MTKQPATWRTDAARIVEQLFPVTPAAAWDLLIDLRTSLLRGNDWHHTLDLFLACRERLELEHYLPFYRLRCLLSGSLQLETITHTNNAQMASLRQVLWSHNSLADFKKAIHRELFEHHLETPREIHLRVSEA